MSLNLDGFRGKAIYDVFIPSISITTHVSHGLSLSQHEIKKGIDIDKFDNAMKIDLEVVNLRK